MVFYIKQQVPFKGLKKNPSAFSYALGF